MRLAARRPDQHHAASIQVPRGDEAVLAIGAGSSWTVTVRPANTIPASAKSRPRCFRVSARLPGSKLMSTGLMYHENFDRQYS
jgi:hypothetical protein